LRKEKINYVKKKYLTKATQCIRIALGVKEKYFTGGV